MKETIKNLAAAYVGESQARNRYTYYAKVARLEGYRKISEIFTATAEQERTHAKRLFEHLTHLIEKSGEKSEELLIDQVKVPHVYDNTTANLKAAIEGESYENSEMYPSFAQKADAEGYPEIANRMRAIAKAEEHHQERFQKLLDLVESNYFEREEEKSWVCLECGYIHTGKTAPQKCPSCDHSQAHYEVKCEEF